MRVFGEAEKMTRVGVSISGEGVEAKGDNVIVSSALEGISLAKCEGVAGKAEDGDFVSVTGDGVSTGKAVTI